MKKEVLETSAPTLVGSKITAFHYAVGRWLVTYRMKETGLLEQWELPYAAGNPKPSSEVKLGGRPAVFFSACRIADDYDPARHDLATCLAYFRTHP